MLALAASPARASCDLAVVAHPTPTRLRAEPHGRDARDACRAGSSARRVPRPHQRRPGGPAHGRPGRGHPARRAASPPWRSFEAVEYAALDWVDGSNHRRLLTSTTGPWPPDPGQTVSDTSAVQSRPVRLAPRRVHATGRGDRFAARR